jgi:hypothetical protein
MLEARGFGPEEPSLAQEASAMISQSERVLPVPPQVRKGEAGARSKQKVEREGIDQDVKLLGLKIIIPPGPIKHEERPSNRTVEVDRP